LAILVARFHELDRQFKHPGRRDSADQRRLYNVAQTELFNIVQALVGLAHSCVQRQLTEIRREMVAQLRAGFKTGVTGAQANVVHTAPLRWYEVQITPEITISREYVGNAILAEDLRKLRQAMRNQQALLDGLLSGR